MALLLRAGVEEALQGLWIFFKEGGKVGENLDCGRAEVVLDAFNVVLLGFGVQPEEGKKARQGLVPLSNPAGDLLALWGADEAAIFFVVEVAQFAKLLDHASDGGLLHLK